MEFDVIASGVIQLDARPTVKVAAGQTVRFLLNSFEDRSILLAEIISSYANVLRLKPPVEPIPLEIKVRELKTLYREMS